MGGSIAAQRMDWAGFCSVRPMKLETRWWVSQLLAIVDPELLIRLLQGQFMAWPESGFSPGLRTCFLDTP